MTSGQAVQLVRAERSDSLFRRCGYVYPHSGIWGGHRLFLCAFLLAGDSPFGARFQKKYWNGGARPTTGAAPWRPHKPYTRMRECVKMQGANPVLEALAKPQFATVKVGRAFYREIQVPESVRAYMDTPYWDQKAVGAAHRKTGKHEPRRMEQCEVYASVTTASKDSEEDTSDDEKERRRAFAEQERMSGGTSSKDEDEQACGAAGGVTAAAGTSAASKSADAPSFCKEEGPSLDPSSGKWTLRLHIRTPLYKIVVGNKKGKLAGIMKEYHVQCTARYGAPHAVVNLQAEDEAALIHARGHIRKLVQKKKETLPYTHYIGLSLTDPNFLARYNIFKTQVLAAYPDFDTTLFQAQEHMHITVLLLKLATDEEEVRCKGLLESISAEIYDAVDTRSLVLHLKGLQIMNDDPSEASVVYTSQYTGNEKDQETSRRLHRLCSVVARAYRAADLVSQKEMTLQGLDAEAGDDSGPKLHATLLNSKFRARGGPRAPQSGRQPWKPFSSFDATELLCNFKLFDFFSCRVPTVELISRPRFTAGGSPVTVASVRLP